MNSAAPSLARRSRLVRYLTVAYTLLVAYASLFPFSPWRPIASSAFSFLLEPWPRYTIADVVLNLLGYLPLGLLLTLTAMAWIAPRWAALSATVVGTCISLVLEAAQSFLPQRVPSNLDLLSNGLGAMAGALIAVAGGERRLLSGHLFRLRSRLFVPGPGADLGFVVLVLWLFCQLYPAVWLFGTGDLRSLGAGSHRLLYDPASYRWIEAGVTALNLAAVGLLVSALARPQQRVAGLLLGLIGVALAVKSAAALTLFKSGDASLWLTPGALLGIPAGVVLYLALAGMQPAWMSWSAAMLLIGGVALINVAPENPYIQASIQTWQRGHFLSFNGTTRLVFSVWPFLAVGYLVWWGRRRDLDSRTAPTGPHVR